MNMQSNMAGVWPVSDDSMAPLGDITNTRVDHTWAAKEAKLPSIDNCNDGGTVLGQPLQLQLAPQLSDSGSLGDFINSSGAFDLFAAEPTITVDSSLSAPLCNDLFTPAPSPFIQQPIDMSDPTWVAALEAQASNGSLGDSLMLERIGQIAQPIAPLETIPLHTLAQLEPMSIESLAAQIPVATAGGGLAESLLSYVASQAPIQLQARGPAGLNAVIAADGPSGPRRLGEGIDDSIQSLISIQQISADCTVVYVTLLVSGFIIGPKGASIREIQKCTGAHIRSYNKDMSPNQPKIVRAFTIQGSTAGQALALDFFKAAIDRYKYLAEGACRGMRVSHVQNIHGIDFFYSPPPKNIVPHAAGLHPLDDSERNLCMRASKAKRTQEAADRLQAILKTHFK